MYVAALNIISALDWTIYNFCIFCVRRLVKIFKNFFTRIESRELVDNIH